ncbi:MAG: hypothetical protein BHW00_02630 [Clostridium sp. 26_22]|jgi:hypothetical protein|nr:MAG: hypothetical protein BHW00_02630 [Clostridium sp. 26_22]
MEKDKNDIYEQAANWWADKIRENNVNKINEAKIGIFKTSLATLIEHSFKLNGQVTILMKTDNILAKSMLEADIFINDFMFTLKDEMKLTPHLFTIYDKYGNLQTSLSL